MVLTGTPQKNKNKMNELIDEIMFKLLATSDHPDKEWLENRLTEGLNDLVDVYGLYRENILLDELTSDTEMGRMSFSEWLESMGND